MGVMALCMLIGMEASARDRWTHPYPGVRHLHRVEHQLDVHVVLVDLGSAELSVVTTSPKDRGINVREFAQRYDAAIAINANYYDLGVRPCGLAAGDGNVYDDAYREACVMSLGFGALNEALAFNSRNAMRGPLPKKWMQHAVSGKPWLVRKGRVQGSWHEPSHMYGHHPRTAVGLSEDNNTLIIAVADGRRKGFPGLTGQGMARLMADAGAHNAVNFDGGGSSALYVEEEGGIVNRPSGRKLRDVVNHLGIRVQAGKHWYSAKLDAVSAAPGLEPGERAKLWARYTNTGRMPWFAKGKRRVLFASQDSRPSPFYDLSWPSTTAAAALSQTVAPGQSAIFNFEVAAPAMIGDFSLNFIPKVAENEQVVASPVSWILPVAGSLKDPEPPTAALAPQELPGTPRRSQAPAPTQLLWIPAFASALYLLARRLKLGTA